MIKMFLLFVGITMILIGFYENQKIVIKNDLETKENEKKINDMSDDVFKNAGVGTSEDILKQRSTYENQFETKPGEIFDNIFNGKIIGLLSS